MLYQRRRLLRAAG